MRAQTTAEASEPLPVSNALDFSETRSPSLEEERLSWKNRKGFKAHLRGWGKVQDITFAADAFNDDLMRVLFGGSIPDTTDITVWKDPCGRWGFTWQIFGADCLDFRDWFEIWRVQNPNDTRSVTAIAVGKEWQTYCRQHIDQTYFFRECTKAEAYNLCFRCCMAEEFASQMIHAI